MLIRFWFTFEKLAERSVLDMGCGITAYDLSDARSFLQEQVFPAYGLRTVTHVKEDVDVRTLEANHVRPNMGNPAVRGVWFPLI